MNELATADVFELPEPQAPPVVFARGLHKSYLGGDGSRLLILDEAELLVHPREVVAVIGESGCGKSTLLQLLGGLDRPDSGEVRVGGTDLNALGDNELSRVRNERIGFVFQFHHLLREFTALENVMMPQLIAGAAAGVARERARELLSEVGLARRLEHKPTQLSGGEQQRVAVARALANRPLVLLADEPTGNLDTTTSAQLHDLLFEVGTRYGSGMVLVTHDMHLAERADRILTLDGGRLVDVRRPRPE
jgi:lipoprotein-releasing system ATP-binding protein